MIFCVKVVCCIIQYFLQNIQLFSVNKRIFYLNLTINRFLINLTQLFRNSPFCCYLLLFTNCTIFIIKQLMTELHLLARRKKKNFNIDNSIPVLRIFNFLFFFFTFCLYYKKQLKVVDNACVSFLVLLTRRRKNELNSQGKTQTLQNCSGIKLKRKE